MATRLTSPDGRMSVRRAKKRNKMVMLYGLCAICVCAALAVFAYRLGARAQAPVAEATPMPTPIIAALSATTPIPTPTPTPEPTPIPTPPLYPQTTSEPDYSFFWFTDTQHYAKKYPETFHKMTKWMAENIDTYNTKYVFFTGDVVHNFDDKEQWAVANEAMKQLDGVVPYTMIGGNHDVGKTTEDRDYYLSYFGKKRFSGNKNITSWMEDGMGRCDVFTINDTDYIVLGFSYGISISSGIRWMNQRLAEYPNHHAILLQHDYMTTDGQLSDAGKQVHAGVVVKNPNVFMVLCGHRYNCTLLVTSINDAGDYLSYRTVYNVMMNYQAFENGGDGYLAIIRVYENDKMFTIDTYSPTLDDWYRVDPARSVNKERLVLPVTIFDPPPPDEPAQ